MKKIFFVLFIFMILSSIANWNIENKLVKYCKWNEVSFIWKFCLFQISDLNKIFLKNENPKTLEIAFGWDLMLSRTVWYLNKRDWFDRIFKKFHPNKIFSKNTLLFYNLESPFSEIDNDKLIQTFIFRANKKNIQVLNDLKLDKNMVISLANNHITNAWWEGIDTSLELLKENNILSVWVGRENQEFKSINQNWVKVCFWAYTYDWQEFYSKDKNKKIQKYFINKISKEKITIDLENMKKANCEFKIISLHWGVEYRKKPNQSQKELAHLIIDNWADLIIWWHTHIFWEVEKYKWKKIFYSLWNFIFDQNWWKNTNETWVDYEFDEKLWKKTVQTYIWNTFYQKYEIHTFWNKLLEEKNVKHRIQNWALSEY